jgi:hypothetical protein
MGETGYPLCIAYGLAPRVGFFTQFSPPTRLIFTPLTSWSLFYCIVDFGTFTGKRPFTYVVPAYIVATCLSENHQAWLSMPGAKGQPHKDNDLRRCLPDYSHLGQVR